MTMAADINNKHDIYSIIQGEPWKGRVLFTGPDMIGDHRVTVQPEHRQIGIGTMSPEGTSETDYLWRPSTGTPFPRPKSTRVGEVGWGLPFMSDHKITQSGRQIVLGEFRQLCENGHTHKYQNPWYPGPRDDIDPDSDAALVMNVYKPRTPGARSGSKRSNYSNRKYGRVPSATATTNYYPQYRRQTNYDFFTYTPGKNGDEGLESDGSTIQNQQ